MESKNRRLIEVLQKNQLLNQNGEIILNNSSKLLNTLSDEFDRQDEFAANTSAELEKLRIVIDSNPCTISWINKDLTYAGVNKTLANICGVTPNDFVGKIVGSYSKDDYFTRFTKRLFTNSDGYLAEEVTSNINESERTFWVLGTRFNHDQQAVIIGVDITELHKLEDTIEFMDKLSSLGEMVAGIVHEVNNPLAAIKANAQLIEKHIQNKNYDKAIDVGHKIDATSDRITEIIKGIKNFVRRGGQDAHEDMVISQIIGEAYLICEGKFKQKNVNFINPDKNLDLILNCSHTEIFQVFVNLMTNAVDAVENLQERWVKIQIESRDNKKIITFTDSGKGLTENVRKNLFRSFYTTKGKGKGTGLGLSLCKKIIEAHNGSIEVDSSQPNTTFVITFNA